MTYTAGTKYLFRIVINIATDTYDVYVTPEGQAEQTHSTGLAFRSAVAQLNNKAVKQASVTTGTINVCNFSIFTGEVTLTPTNTPSPTPTPGPWFKLKDASFSKKGTYTNQIPAVVYKFKSGDPDDTTLPYLIANDANTDPNDPGVVIIPDPSAAGQTFNPSNKDWLNSNNYTYAAPFTPATFLAYIKSRKEYRTVTDLGGLTSGTYLYDGPPLTIDNTKESQVTSAAPVVLAFTGDVTINSGDNIFGNSAAPQSVVILSGGTINIAPNMQELYGLFIANQINFGSSATPLKIVGNVISQNPANPTTRTRADLTRPSVFIVVRPGMYLNLLPYFSTATYEWKQLQ